MPPEPKVPVSDTRGDDEHWKGSKSVEMGTRASANQFIGHKLDDLIPPVVYVGGQYQTHKPAV